MTSDHLSIIKWNTMSDSIILCWYFFRVSAPKTVTLCSWMGKILISSSFQLLKPIVWVIRLLVFNIYIVKYCAADILQCTIHFSATWCTWGWGLMWFLSQHQVVWLLRYVLAELRSETKCMVIKIILFMMLPHCEAIWYGICLHSALYTVC